MFFHSSRCSRPLPSYVHPGSAHLRVMTPGALFPPGAAVSLIANLETGSPCSLFHVRNCCCCCCCPSRRRRKETENKEKLSLIFRLWAGLVEGGVGASRALGVARMQATHSRSHCTSIGGKVSHISRELSSFSAPLPGAAEPRKSNPQDALRTHHGEQAKPRPA